MANELRERISNKVCVLHDATGRVVHIHRAVTLAGGRIMTDDELKERTRERAKAAGLDVSALSTLQVDGEKHEDLCNYRVDIATGQLRQV